METNTPNTPVKATTPKHEIVQPAGIAEESKQVEVTTAPYESAEADAQWEVVKNNIALRKFDSDDVVRMRGRPVTMSVSAEGELVRSADAGLSQKYAIILGVKSAPWFTDTIDEKVGVTDEIFNKRSKSEFRQIPTDFVDRIFTEVAKLNPQTFAPKEYKKK